MPSSYSRIYLSLKSSNMLRRELVLHDPWYLSNRSYKWYLLSDRPAIVYEVTLANIFFNNQMDTGTDGNLLDLKASVEWLRLGSRYSESQSSLASAFRGGPISC